MKHVKLDRQPEQVKNFIRSLDVGGKGAIIELAGKRLLKLMPITDEPVDSARLKECILRRRQQSRRLNSEWDAVDREMWERLDRTEE